MMALPHWKPIDEENLRRRVRRMAGERQVVDQRPMAIRPDPPICLLGCADGDHSHAAVRVGPYTICRCLMCPAVAIDAG